MRHISRATTRYSQVWRRQSDTKWRATVTRHLLWSNPEDAGLIGKMTDGVDKIGVSSGAPLKRL